MSSNITHPVILGIREQRTFCMVKPDGVMRGLVGEIVARIEKPGLKVVGLKMVTATKEQIVAHYPMSDQAWIDRLGDKGLSTFKELELMLKSTSVRMIGARLGEQSPIV